LEFSITNMPFVAFNAAGIVRGMEFVTWFSGVVGMFHPELKQEHSASGGFSDALNVLI
jgi:hypothetical protein